MCCLSFFISILHIENLQYIFYYSVTEALILCTCNIRIVSSFKYKSDFCVDFAATIMMLCLTVFDDDTTDR